MAKQASKVTGSVSVDESNDRARQEDYDPNVVPSGAAKKILTIDGGGIKGVFAAAFLADLEETLGEPLHEYFDLISGTSTGGIIALGLGMGLSAADILAFYQNRGPEIFRGVGGFSLMRQLGAAKYNVDPLKQALIDVFGETRLGDSKVRLLVPSLDLETGQVHVFKTAHHSRFVRDYKVGMVDVALATAAAPTYFPTHRLAAGIPLIDGGMWANNPMGPAAVEAIGVLGWSKGSVSMLGVGCTEPPLNASADRKRRLGLLNYWAKRLMSVVMAGQSSSSLGTAQLLLGHENVVRVSPSVPNGRFSLDGVKGIESLRGLGSSCARTEFPRLREQFFSQKAERFVPELSENSEVTQ